MKKNEMSLLSDNYIKKFQESFLIHDIGTTLNHSKIADTMGIATSNTKFRTFLKGESLSISSEQLIKMLDSVGYDLLVIPVRQDSSEYKELIEKSSNNVDKVSEQLVNIRLRHERKRTSKIILSDDIPNKFTINDALFSDDDISNDLFGIPKKPKEEKKILSSQNEVSKVGLLNDTLEDDSEDDSEGSFFNIPEDVQSELNFY